MSKVRFSALAGWLATSLVASSLILVPAIPVQANNAVTYESDTSLDFSSGGAASTINTEVIPADKTFTVEAWIKPDTHSGPAFKVIASQNQDGGGVDNDRFFFGLHWNVNQYQIHYACDSTPGDFITVPGGIKVNEWSHVAIAHSTADYKIFVDGVLVQTNSVSSCEIGSSVAAFTIGSTGGAREDIFKGEIDQLKIWNETLATAEVAASMHEIAAPAGTNKTLRARYDFNETTGVTVNNRVSGNYNLTLSGTYAKALVSSRVVGEPARGLSIVAPRVAPSGFATLSGTVSALAGVQILSVEATTGSFTIGTLPSGVTANSGVTGVNPIALKGDANALNLALRAIRYNAPAVNASVTLSGKVMPLITTTSSVIQNPLTGHFYRVNATGSSMDTAIGFAQTQTQYGSVGYLANITSQTENSYLAAQATAMPTTFGAQLYIGLSDRNQAGFFSSTWSWITGPASGQAVSIGHIGESTGKSLIDGVYSSWELNEPNGNSTGSGANREANCAVTNFNAVGIWDDTSCTGPLSSLMEFGGSAGDPGFASAAFRVEQTVVDVEFTELNFDYANSINVAPRANAARCVNSTADCNGKLGGDKVLFKNVTTRDGVSVDALVTTQALASGTVITKYEVGTRAGGEPSFFEIDARISTNGNSAAFTFEFFLADTYLTGPIKVRLKNVNLSAIDVDYFQFNDLSNVDGYTTAVGTNLRTCVALTQVSSCTTSTANPTFGTKPNFLRFQGRSGYAENDTKDMGIATYGSFETFAIRFGTTTGGSNENLFGVAFKAMPWAPNTPQSFGQSYAITYNENGGTGAAPSAQTGALASRLTLAGQGAMLRSGNSFLGWNTEANGSGTAYAAGATFTIPDGGDILYAQWAPILYTLTYDANGGGSAPGTQQIAAGSTGRLSSTEPVRTGYTFKHWSTNQNGSGSTFSALANYTMPGANTSIYAQWDVVTGTLSYNGNLGNTTQTSTTVTAGATVRVASGGLTSRTGYTFAGWNTAANASGTDYVSGSSIVVPQGTTILYAQWTPILYSINYIANGGTGAPANSSAVSGQSVTLSSIAPSRSGYVFAGWNRAQNGSSTSFSVAQVTEMSASNLVLYAQWSARSYSLSYSINSGDSGLPATQSEVAFGSATIASSTPLRSGFKFNGWNTIANGSGTNYSTGSSLVMPASDVVLYAQWVSNLFDVVYNANGGNGAPEPSSASSMPITIASTASSRPGHIFDGWSLFPNGSGAKYVAGDSFMISGDTFFFARWIAELFSLIYDVNGGDTSAPSSSSANVSQSVTINATTPSRSGFVFTGWASSLSGAAPVYLGGNSFLMPANDVTLFAVWSGAPFTLTYNANGGGSGPANQTLRTQESTLVGSFVSRPGYVFTGWNTAADGSGATYSPNAVFTMPGENVTMYAQWALAMRNISFDDNSGSTGPADVVSEFQTVVTIPATLPVRPGFNFTGWNTLCNGLGTPYQPGDVLNMPATNLALCAQWSAITYLLDYDVNGGINPPASEMLAAGALTSASGLIPQRTGYSFIAWNTAADGSGTRHLAGSDFTMPAGATTLYALWIANPYAVYYNANGGSGAPSAQPSRTGESLTLTSSAPTRPGYRFVDWNTDALGDATGYSSSAAITMPAQNLTLFAQWDFVRYTLTYNANGGSAAPSSETNLTVSQDVVLDGGTPNRNGFTFVGWNRAQNGSGATFASGATLVMPAQNVTLWAVWVAQEFEVIYNANGGTGGPASQAASTSATVTIPANEPTRSGYEFDYWTDTQAGSGPSYSPSSTFTMPAGGKTLFAQWSEKSVSISYNINGGTGSPPSDAVASFSDAIPLAPGTGFSKSGQALLGWNTEQNGTGIMYSPEQVISMPADDLVLYAQWSSVFYALAYNAAGGSGEPAGTIATAGQSVPIPSVTPSRTGFDFTQWNSVGGGSSYIPGGTLIMPPNNYILFATWALPQQFGGIGGGGPVILFPTGPALTLSPTVSPTASPSVSPTLSPTSSPSQSPNTPNDGVDVETDGQPKPPKKPGNQVIDYMVKEEKYDPNTFENWNSGDGEAEDVVVEADTTSLNDSQISAPVILEAQPEFALPQWLFWLGGLPFIGAGFWLLSRRRRS